MQNLEELKNRALLLMQSAGFPISEKISVAIDEKLPFMGYTTEKNGKPLIIVSGWAVSSEMLIGLLIHELSHIYRIETHHPSHDFAIHNKVLSLVLGKKKLLSYQQETIHNIINSIQDLYADDIFFKVFKHNTVNLTDFFLGWIHNPITDSSEKSMWTNAGFVVSTAFAQANLKRHKVHDTEGKVREAVKVFLSKCEPKTIQKFKYFKKVMVNLPEQLTEESFTKLLLGYIRNFLSLTNPI
jgi:hypothetical protein